MNLHIKANNPNVSSQYERYDFICPKDKSIKSCRFAFISSQFFRHTLLKKIKKKSLYKGEDKYRKYIKEYVVLPAIR